MKKGKLIVIDGSDGSGKQTQSQLLLNFLKEKSYPVKYFDFPRYDTFYGKIVARFLSGEFGKMRIECLEKSGDYPTLQVEARVDDEIFCSLPQFLKDTRVVSLSKGIKTFVQNERNRLEQDFKTSLRPLFLSPEKVFSQKEDIEETFPARL